MTVTAGVIANPASGKDIRRLVAHASVFGNDEKVNIVRRVLLGLDAAGVERVLYMPDPHRLVPRALDEIDLAADVAAVEITARGDVRDTTAAAAALQAAGANVIVSLGGDGTNRAVARGAPDVPLVPISTGTNNVFPVMVEGTVAGLAAGAVASGAVDAAEVAARCKWIVIDRGDAPDEVALVDAVLMRNGFVGSRAIWETDAIREVVLTRAAADAVGMAAVGGMLEPVEPHDDFGLHLVLGSDGVCVSAAIAPGLIRPVALARVERLALGATVPVCGPALLALDGERELPLAAGERATLRVTRSGPPVVDIARCLAAARRAGFLRRSS
jgi:hypothetical protein